MIGESRVWIRPWLRRAAWSGALASLLLSAPIRGDVDAGAILDRWLASQRTLTSWSADFVQTRHLKALTQPLTAPGRLWFAAPDRFRWELGSPVQSIAVRADADLLVLAPQLKRAERYPLAALARGPLKDAMALLDTGFPREAAEFHRRFDLIGVAETNAFYVFNLRPTSPAVRRVLPRLSIRVATNDFGLAGTELIFADGSRMDNEFTRGVRNPRIDEALFSPRLDPAWIVTEPLGRK